MNQSFNLEQQWLQSLIDMTNQSFEIVVEIVFNVTTFLSTLFYRMKNNYPGSRMKYYSFQETTHRRTQPVSRLLYQGRNGQWRTAWMTSQKVPSRKRIAWWTHWTRRNWTLQATSGPIWALLSQHRTNVSYARVFNINRVDVMLIFNLMFLPVLLRRVSCYKQTKEIFKGLISGILWLMSWRW